MKLKKLWRTANRGVILAIVLILGLAAFVTYDKATFNKEKPMIEEIMQNYFTEYLSAVQASDTQKADKGPWSLEKSTERYNELTAVLDKYFTSKSYKSSHTYYGYDKEEFAHNLKATYLTLPKDYNTTFEQLGYVDEINHNVSNMKISKNGPSAATFTCTLRINATSKGYAYYTDIVGEQFSSNGYYYDFSELDNKDTDAESSMQLEYAITCELLRINGQWKLSTIRSNGVSYSSANTKNLEVA